MAGSSRGPLLYRFLHAVVPPVLNALYRPTAQGLENIPETGPAILASNHTSMFDVLFFPSAVARPVYFLAKSDYFSGLSRHFFANVGVVPIARTGGDAAEAALRKGQEILAGGELLGIYPEGTRSPDGRLYRGKTGPVRLAIRTGVPVVPVAMIGTWEIMPPGAKVPKIRRVEMRIGKPLDFSRYAGNADDHFTLRSATDELMYEIMLLSGQEYVDEYAAAVKSGDVPEALRALDDLGQMLDEDPFDIRRAS